MPTLTATIREELAPAIADLSDNDLLETLREALTERADSRIVLALADEMRSRGLSLRS